VGLWGGRPRGKRGTEMQGGGGVLENFEPNQQKKTTLIMKKEERKGQGEKKRTGRHPHRDDLTVGEG